MADIATNKKAFHNYQIVDSIEAGIVLQGTEVKSCRAAQVQLLDGYAMIRDGEVFLYKVHISPYAQGNVNNHEPTRVRKLLLNKTEIRKLTVATREKGLQMIPLNFHLSKGKVKVRLGLCKSKTKGDKRETLKRKQANRETARATKFRV